jgi:hypothetical protein
VELVELVLVGGFAGCCLPIEDARVVHVDVAGLVDAPVPANAVDAVAVLELEEYGAIMGNAVPLFRSASRERPSIVRQIAPRVARLGPGQREDRRGRRRRSSPALGPAPPSGPAGRRGEPGSRAAGGSPPHREATCPSRSGAVPRSSRCRRERRSRVAERVDLREQVPDVPDGAIDAAEGLEPADVVRRISPLTALESGASFLMNDGLSPTFRSLNDAGCRSFAPVSLCWSRSSGSGRPWHLVGIAGRRSRAVPARRAAGTAAAGRRHSVGSAPANSGWGRG